MAEERVERRLAAILAADMVAYSRLMEADEEGTIARQKVHRAELIDPTIAEYGGRIVKLMGDGALVEFPSVVDAVKCAATIQRAMAEREAEVPEDLRIRYRMGVNLGDIVIDGDDILGDGVNIAARLESLAEPGGVCISGAAYDQLKATVDVGYADLGEQQVKNIDKPVRVYRVLLDAEAAGTVCIGATRRWRIPAIAAALVVIIAGGIAGWQLWIERTVTVPVEPELPERAALPLPDNPSIAVLPFNNLSGDFFAEVFQLDATENVSTALSMIAEMIVIPRSSTLPYKDKAVDVQEAAQELGARYILEGSVRRFGEQVRITATLTDTQKARKLWGGAFNRELQDASAVQEEITRNVVAALELELVEGAGDRIVRGNTNSANAYALVRRGLSLFQGDTLAENAEARRLFEEAVELDPNYSIAWHLLGYTYNAASRRGWGKGRAQEQARAAELARKALANDPSASGPYILLSTISQLALRYDEALTHGEKAVALAPNDAMTVAQMGRILFFVGRPDEALPMIQRAVRLSPYTPPPILFFEGLGYHSLDRYAEAIRALDDASVRTHKKTLPFALLAITSADLGRIDEARVAVQAVLRVNPKFSAKGFMNLLDYEDHAKSERAVATLVELGLPE